MGDSGGVTFRILVTRPSIYVKFCIVLNSETSLTKDSKYFDQNFQRLSETLS
jgi:hypothetical protein